GQALQKLSDTSGAVSDVNGVDSTTSNQAEGKKDAGHVAPSPNAPPTDEPPPREINKRYISGPLYFLGGALHSAVGFAPTMLTRGLLALGGGPTLVASQFLPLPNLTIATKIDYGFSITLEIGQKWSGAYANWIIYSTQTTTTRTWVWNQ